MDAEKSKLVFGLNVEFGRIRTKKRGKATDFDKTKSHQRWTKLLGISAAPVSRLCRF